MKIRIIKGFNGYKVGQEFEWGDGMARMLIARGMIEAVREEAIERATVENRMERAVVNQAVRRAKK